MTRWIPPLAPGGAYLERYTSVTSTMPLAWGLTMVMGIAALLAAWSLAVTFARAFRVVFE